MAAVWLQLLLKINVLLFSYIWMLPIQLLGGQAYTYFSFTHTNMYIYIYIYINIKRCIQATAIGFRLQCMLNFVAKWHKTTMTESSRVQSNCMTYCTEISLSKYYCALWLNSVPRLVFNDVEWVYVPCTGSIGLMWYRVLTDFQWIATPYRLSQRLWSSAKNH